MLRVHEVAQRIAAAHAGGEVLVKRVAEQLLAAAIAARVPVALNGVVLLDPDLREAEPLGQAKVPGPNQGSGPL